MKLTPDSLVSKVLLSLMAGILGALLISSIAFILVDVHLSKTGLENECRIRAGIIGQNAAASLLFEDSPAAQEDLAALKIDPYLREVKLFRADKTLFASFTSSPSAPGEPVFQIHEPIQQAGQVVGYIEMNSSFGAFYDRLNSYLWMVLAILVITALLSFPLALLLQRFISAPILRLATAVQHISQSRNFTRKVPPGQGKELRILTGGINEMLVQIVLHEQELRAEMNERRIAEKKQLSSERNLKITLNAMTEAVVAADVHGAIQWFNPVAETLLGFPQTDVVGHPLQSFLPMPQGYENLFRNDPVFQDQSRVGTLSVHTMVLYTEKGRQDVQYSIAPIVNEMKINTGYVFVFRNVTEQKKMEEHLRHSQKMDAVGQLAGGIAHDFNNILAGIMGSAELLLLTEVNNGKSGEYINLILKMATRATDLTRKLLSFSRKDSAVHEIMDLSDVIRDVVSILEHTIDPRIVLKKELPEKPLYIKGNAAQIQNALLNLGLNARDAMPDGGTLTCTAQNVFLDDTYCQQHPEVKTPGHYVEICMTDTGYGMSRAIQERVFEPFFTTKGMGKGTGLGLAAVYGIVQDHQGAIFLYSEEGQGTTFKMVIPSQDDDPYSGSEESSPMPGSERILLVDDEKIIRDVTSSMLQQLGYRVVCAENGEDALQILRADTMGFDLVLLDMIMPVKNGEETFLELKKTHPNLPVIITTGFSPAGVGSKMLQQGVRRIVQKPFKVASLTFAIREVLSGSNE